MFWMTFKINKWEAKASFEANTKLTYSIPEASWLPGSWDDLTYAAGEGSFGVWIELKGLIKRWKLPGLEDFYDVTCNLLLRPQTEKDLKNGEIIGAMDFHADNLARTGEIEGTTLIPSKLFDRLWDSSSRNFPPPTQVSICATPFSSISNTLEHPSWLTNLVWKIGKEKEIIPNAIARVSIIFSGEEQS